MEHRFLVIAVRHERRIFNHNENTVPAIGGTRGARRKLVFLLWWNLLACDSEINSIWNVSFLNIAVIFDKG